MGCINSRTLFTCIGGGGGVKPANLHTSLVTRKLLISGYLNESSITSYHLLTKINQHVKYKSNPAGVDTNLYGHLPCRADRYKIHLPSPRCHLPPIYTQNITFSSYFYLINRISVYRHPVQSAFYTAPSRRYTQLSLPCLQCPGIVLTTKPQTSYTASQLHKHS